MPGKGITLDSYRDPSGFIFRNEGRVYRAIRSSYKNQYDRLVSSGLAKRLTDEGLLVGHAEVSSPDGNGEDVYRVIEPDQVPFISYPWEWSFFQLQTAALATLKIQQIAMEYGMTLKDASSLNIQFLCGQPVLIDTLSFDMYMEGRPWIAYRQFCEQFLAPLALGALVDEHLLAITQLHGGSIPLDRAAKMLGRRGWLNAGILVHLHLQSSVQNVAARNTSRLSRSANVMSRKSMLGLVTSLEHSVGRLRPARTASRWSDYQPENVFGENYVEHKKALVAGIIDELHPRMVWDMGCNRGIFSRIAAAGGARVLAMDRESSVVGQLYLDLLKSGEQAVLPLVLDIAFPSPGTGWVNKEFRSLFERGRSDLTIALALVHHLAIGSNLPFANIARLFELCCDWLAIEFVPKDDPNVRLMLKGRTDIFDGYTERSFQAAFGETFEIRRRVPLYGSGRSLYLMKNKTPSVTA